MGSRSLGQILAGMPIDGHTIVMRQRVAGCQVGRTADVACESKFSH